MVVCKNLRESAVTWVGDVNEFKSWMAGIDKIPLLGQSLVARSQRGDSARERTKRRGSHLHSVKSALEGPDPSVQHPKSWNCPGNARVLST